MKIGKFVITPWMLLGISVAVCILLAITFIRRESQLTNQVRALETKQAEKPAVSVQPSPPTQSEITTLVSEVGTMVVLPEGETPTVATVTDLERLKTQEFFSRAQNGDKVLVYQSARLAVLYRPTIKKVLTVSTVNIGTTPPGIPPTPSVSAVQTTKINAPSAFLLLNGTSITGLTKQVEADLLKQYPNAIIADKDNAKKKTYAKSLLIDMTGKNQELGTSIAKKLNLEFTDLPSSEATSGGTYDFIIIVGSDRK